MDARMREWTISQYLEHQINLAGRQGALPEQLASAMARSDEIIRRADQLTAAVRAEVTG